MSIRAATADDVPTLVALGRRMHAESPHYSVLVFSDVKLGGFLGAALQTESMCVFVAESDGEIVGAIAGGIFEHWCSLDRMAADLALFIDPDKRGSILAARLVRAFVEWARQNNAKLVHLGISSGIRVEETGRLYQALGLVPCGTIYKAAQ